MKDTVADHDEVILLDVPIELDRPIIDATDLVIGETTLDNDDYDEIVIDLRKREHQDAWLV